MKQSTAINQLLQGPRLDRESDELLERPLSGPRRRIRVTTALPVQDLPTLAPRGTPPASFDPILRVRSSQDVVTHLVRRQPRSRVPRPLAVAALSLGVIAAGAAGYRIFHGKPAPAAIVAAAPPAPTVSPIAPAAEPPASAFVDIQLASEPAGATVTLIDDGHALLLGTTPLTAALDPSRAHDLVFALDGRAPRTAHVDAHATADVSVRLPRVSHKRHR